MSAPLAALASGYSGRILTVPNWSVGRERGLIRQMRDVLDSGAVVNHFCEADIDHNRTVTAFSGEVEPVLAILDQLCQLAMPTANLQRHTGVHPRIGALDVLPFVAAPGGLSEDKLIDLSRRVGQWLAETYDLPVFLYDKSARRAHADLPHLRRGGFGGLVGRELTPDFGPPRVHPHLGASVVGVRDFLVALNVNFRGDDVVRVERVASAIRQRRRSGEPGWKGVRALGLRLGAQSMVQVSLNFCQPDLTPIDPVVDWAIERASPLELAFVELIGVIRNDDLVTGHRVAPRPAQIVW